MKKAIISILILVVTIASYAQEDTSKVEQYCQVIATPRLLSNKVTIEIDFGEQRSIWRNERLRTYDGRLKKFNTIIDALNFMGLEGWVFINAYAVKMGETDIYHFAFKKQVSKAELREKELVRF
jgi:hypothetical protein